MFVVCGEALMDVFAAGDTPSGMALDARVGGSPFNVAVGLARLGQNVSLLASISRDFLGQRLVQALDQEGVQTSTVERTDSATTLSLVGLDAHHMPSYAFYGEGGADRQLSRHALQHRPANTRVIHVASYATVVEPIASTLRALVEHEQTRRLVSFDPNVRLNVEPDVCLWVSLLEWMLPRTHVLKISDEDLGLLLPKIGVEDFAAQALAKGVQLVVITRGAKGAMAWTAHHHACTGSIPVPVIDTVGAGDTFQAALLTWMAENAVVSAQAVPNMSQAALLNALSFASRAAAITCSRRGADLPRRHEV